MNKRKTILSIAAVLLAFTLCIIIPAGCQNTGTDAPIYDSATRTPLDEGEIKYTFPERDKYYNYIEVEAKYETDGTMDFYAVGDPSIIKHDGVFYMYSSITRRRKTGSLPPGSTGVDGDIMCWSSRNLIDWTWESVAARDMEGHEDWSSNESEARNGKNGSTYAAYAPEVIYYAGHYYMIQSQFAKGHFLYKADHPTGPFKRVSENQRHGIDAAFYLDDDGQLYIVYLDGDTDRLAYTKVNVDGDSVWLEPDATPVGSVTLQEGGRQVENAYLNGWTEGPHWFRRGDYQYMTYTGNNVRNPGYRVGYSYTTGDLLTELIQPEDNLTLISTEMPYTPPSGWNEEAGKYLGYNAKGNDYLSPPIYAGLGHSGNTNAPNLDGIYTAYHNEYTAEGHQFNRRLNIDQYFTNDSLVHTNGIGLYEKPKPAMPDYDSYGRDALYVAGGFLLTDRETGDIFTAELNYKNPELSAAQIIVGYRDTKNYGLIRIENDVISFSRIRNGAAETLVSKNIGGLNDYTKLNIIRIESGVKKTHIYYNHMRVLSFDEAIGGGRIGYSSNLTVGATQFTNDVFGTSDFEAIKNLPSAFPAYTYLKGENRGFSISGAKADPDGVRQGEKESARRVMNRETGEEFAAVTLRSGDWVKYAVNAGYAGTHALNLQVNKASAGAIVEVIVDGEHIYRMDIPENLDFDRHDYGYINAGYFDLDEAGYHTIKLRVFHGDLDFATVRIEKGAEKSESLSYKFTPDAVEDEAPMQNVERLNGFFRITTRGLRTDNSDTGVFRIANSGRSDIRVSSDVILNSSADKGGFFLRMTNYTYPTFSYGTTTTSQSFLGYYVRVDQRSVSLIRYNYGFRTCAQKILDNEDMFSPGVTRNLRVEARGNNIKIYVADRLYIDYSDYSAYLSGGTGIYSENSRMYFKNFTYEEY